jgi:hypothetical protein
LEGQQWEYCHIEIGHADDSCWMCKITYFSPHGITFRELPALKRGRTDSLNPYFKVIGILGMHGWEAISLSTAAAKNLQASGYFKRPIFLGRKIDDLQVML